jgi:hypothetical protein
MYRSIALASSILAAALFLAPSGASAQLFSLRLPPLPIPTPRSVPELDPSGAAAALTLLAGGISLISSRRRRDRS